VASGLAQSGSVDGYVWEALTVAEPSLPAATRVVARSEWLGFPPIACLRDRAATPRMRALANALERMGAFPKGRAVLELLQLDGFQHAETDLFDGIAALARTVDERG
jgi:phosphonate transport system substrate-binding protein